MTLEEAREAKQHLESCIFNLISTFEKETNVAVEKIEVGRITCLRVGTSPDSIVTRIHVEAKL